MIKGLHTCPTCRERVLPTTGDICPSCRQYKFVGAHAESLPPAERPGPPPGIDMRVVSEEGADGRLIHSTHSVLKGIFFLFVAGALFTAKAYVWGVAALVIGVLMISRPFWRMEG
jgi:hypothetical protein